MLASAVRVDLDLDYFSNPVGDPDVVAAESPWLTQGLLTPYSVTVLTDCAGCGEQHETPFSFDGVVVGTDASNEGVFTDLNLIPDQTLRDLARELVAETV